MGTMTKQELLAVHDRVHHLPGGPFNDNAYLGAYYKIKCSDFNNLWEFARDAADAESKDVKSVRQVVYEAIDEERAYQNELPPTRTDGSRKSVGEYVTMLSYYVPKAIAAWTCYSGNSAALDVIRKIAAICVRCMEEHGIVRRSKDENKPA